MENNKNLGQVFTPIEIVNKILSLLNYKNDCINKKILEPSFGEGVFLIEIIEILIKECIKNKLSKKDIISQLENNIYGIELDKEVYNKTCSNIEKLLNKYNLNNVKLNLFNSNTLDFDLNIKFDFIIGNPPYVRVHNMDKYTKEKIKKYKFSNGNTDLYIIFFELCIDKLNKNGKLGFITPNSFLKNSSQQKFRDYLLDNKLITKIIDFKSNKIFNKADTYTAITILDKTNKINSLNYSILLNNKIVEKNIKYSNLINKEWNVSNNNGKFIMKDICNVQHGISTNADNIYISEISDKSEKTVMFNGYEIEKNILIKIIKGSRYNGGEINKRLIFPYLLKDNKYIVMEEKYLKENYPLTYKYLSDNKEKLLNRSLEKNAKWYQFARSQSINTINKEKIVIKHIISNNDKKINYYKIEKNIAVYSGIYITCEDINKVTKIIDNKNFLNYCKDVGKDMSGNYISISAKNIKNYKYN